MKLPSCPEIKPFFPDFSTPMVRNFLLLIYCVLSSRSLSLYKCAEYVPGEALFESKYRRLLRFIRIGRATSFCQGISRLLLAMAPDECYLVIDRTNWKLGERPINLLCLGLVIGERFYLPLLCEPLSKHGSSNTDERIGLLKQFMALKSPGKKYVLLADREFVSRKWLRWLRCQGIELVIRLREGDYLDKVNATKTYTLNKFNRQVHRKGALSIRIKMEGYWFYYTGLIDRKIGGDVVYLLSSYADPHHSGHLYTKRWSIEVFFKQLKSDGFYMESIGLYDPSRLKMLMAVASVAYMVVLQEGFLEAGRRPIKMKHSPGKGRKWAAVSVFRYGYRALIGRIRTLKQFLKRMKKLLGPKKRSWNVLQLYGPRKNVQ